MAEGEQRILDRRRDTGPAPLVPSALERHIQTVLVALLCGVLAWVGNKVTETSEVVSALRAESTVRIDRLQAEMQEVKEKVSRAYSVADALRDLGYRDTIINGLQERVRDLESRLNSMGLPASKRRIEEQ